MNAYNANFNVIIEAEDKDKAEDTAQIIRSMILGLSLGLSIDDVLSGMRKTPAAIAGISYNDITVMKKQKIREK